MKISFIVLTYNRTDALLAVLRALAAQCGPGHEVVIADDGSRPAAVKELYDYLPTFNCPVRHIWHPDTGFTAAACRNLGAHFASGDYLVFLDGDCIPNKRFVSAHTGLAERGFFVNGSRVLLSQTLSDQVLREKKNLLTQPLIFWLKARLRGDSNKVLHVLSWERRLFRVKQGFIWRGIRSCNFGVWRSDFIAVNGFDETFKGWGHEDADLVLRLGKRGLKRKNGFLATEVFHLWHKENQRDHESINRRKVVERIESGLVVAEIGMTEVRADEARVVVLK